MKDKQQNVTRRYLYCYNAFRWSVASKLIQWINYLATCSVVKNIKIISHELFMLIERFRITLTVDAKRRFVVENFPNWGMRK